MSYTDFEDPPEDQDITNTTITNGSDVITNKKDVNNTIDNNVKEFDTIDNNVKDNVKDNKKDAKRLIESFIPLPSSLYNPPYNVNRRSKIILFGYVLNKYENFQKVKWNDKTKLLIKIERSCFNYSIDSANDNNIIPSWDIELFNDIYTSICYKVSTNLDPTGLVKNKQLAIDLLNGKISIKRLPRLTSLDMFPQKHAPVLKRLEASKNIKNNIKTTSMYICGKCKENKCTIENLYNRGLDEGVNLKITCVNCGHEFTA